jgi:hypothetical protein
MLEEGKGVGPAQGPGASRRMPRCIVCGQFLGYRAFDKALVSFHFTPDTHFTAERMEYAHKACEAVAGPRPTFRMEFAP